MRWPHRPDDGGPRWSWRAEFGRGQARGAPRGLTWRELAGTFSGPDGGSAADGAPSGWEWPGSQSCQGATELGFPGPTLWQMQSEASRRADEPSGDREEASSEGLGGHHRLAQTDASCPAGQVVGHDLYGQPSAVGWEAARGEMVQSHAVLEVSDGVLELGVAAMVGLQRQGVPPDRGKYGLKLGTEPRNSQESSTDPFRS